MLSEFYQHNQFKVPEPTCFTVGGEVHRSIDKFAAWAFAFNAHFPEHFKKSTYSQQSNHSKAKDEPYTGQKCIPYLGKMYFSIPDFIVPVCIVINTENSPF